MSSASRELFTVDLRGMRASLVARAAELGITEAEVLRSALAASINAESEASPSEHVASISASGCVKLSVRVSRSAARQLDLSVRASGLSRGAYLSGLILGAPPVTAALDRAQQTAALVASTAELALLSRDVRNLERLLRAGSYRAVDEYRDRFFLVDAEVQKHLDLASVTLAALRPSRSAIDSTRV